MKDTNKINIEFKIKNMKIIWNKLKQHKQTKVISKLISNDFENHFSSIMKDEKILTPEQFEIQKAVSEKCAFITSCKEKPDDNGSINHITRDTILTAIKNLKKGTSPGIDDITSDHLVHATSHKLADLLANVYSIIITSAVIPDLFKNSIIIPILKKPTLDPDNPTNYRPISLSSIHTKLIENTLLPEDTVSGCQFGFRKGRGTMFATSLLNDLAAYTKFSWIGCICL